MQKINDNNNKINKDKFTLEHIIPQKEKNDLTKLSYCNYFGNLTLLEGKNSDNCNKGNYAISSKSYDKKKQTYKSSDSKLTIEIVDTFDKFEESDILKRTNDLLELLNIITEY